MIAGNVSSSSIQGGVEGKWEGLVGWMLVCLDGRLADGLINYDWLILGPVMDT